MARVVVVGGGFGGMASAARLAKLGHRVTIIERLPQLGGAVGFLERDGYRWDTGPAWTLLPAVLRDLFSKSGRPLERELDLLPVRRQHRFADDTVLDLPTGSRAAVIDAVDDALGAGHGRRWADFVHSFAEPWDVLRRNYFEVPFRPDHLSTEALALLRSRLTLQKTTAHALRDERLRRLALLPAVLGGHDPRNVPAWLGLISYLEHTFGRWTIRGGFGRLGHALANRLTERQVTVMTGVTARDVQIDAGRAVGVDTDHGQIEAELVVCAVDPRRLASLAPLVEDTMPALPPAVTHLGLAGQVPDLGGGPGLPGEVVVHAAGTKRLGAATMVVRSSGSGRAGTAAWTVLSRGTLAEDPLTALARTGLDVRGKVETRVDVSVREQVQAWAGSPYGTLWQGRRTLANRLRTTTPVTGVYAAGASVAGATGLPFVGLSAAVVAQVIGRA
jgi:UDP-galactopyranose mutase